MTHTLEAHEAEGTVDNVEVKKLLEALLFTCSEPVPPKKIRDVLENLSPVNNNELKELVNELNEEYETQGRSFRIEEIANGYVFRTCPEFGPHIRQLHHQFRKDRLSHAALEVLSIVAYRQPITRTQIEEIRGVDSSGIVYTLIERQLIESAGRLEVPGRPTLFKATQNFLKHFGLRDMKELPYIEELRPKEPEQPIEIVQEETPEEPVEV